jgi:hypothetical protein
VIGMLNLFATKPTLRAASRTALPILGSVTIIDIACLLACGAAGMFAVGMLHQLRVQLPGHAILRGALPMALGLSLVPRRSAGVVMSLGAGLTAAIMIWGGFGRFPNAAALSVLALGPVIDLAMSGDVRGWRLYRRLTLAGAAANLLAFAFKVAMLRLGWDTVSGGNFANFLGTALVSFIFCGALAGLLSAAVCFRLRNDLRRT